MAIIYQDLDDHEDSADHDLVPEVVPDHDFVHYGTAQVGSIVLQNIAELQCAYLHAFGSALRPDPTMVASFFEEGLHLLLVVTPAYKDNKVMMLTDVMPGYGDINPDDSDVEIDHLDIRMKLYSYDEADAEMRACAQDILGTEEVEDGSDKGFLSTPDYATDDASEDDDDSGAAHRITLIALPPFIRSARVVVIPPGVALPENSESNEEFIVDGFPANFKLAPAKIPDSWKVDVTGDIRYN